jgi:hypothetical protein
MKGSNYSFGSSEQTGLNPESRVPVAETAILPDSPAVGMSQSLPYPVRRCVTKFSLLPQPPPRSSSTGSTTAIDHKRELGRLQTRQQWSIHSHRRTLPNEELTPHPPSRIPIPTTAIINTSTSGWSWEASCLRCVGLPHGSEGS